MKKFITNTKVDLRRKLPIENTRFALAVPHSLLRGYPDGKTEVFRIGNVRFGVVGRYSAERLRPLDPIPESWFIDLSQDVLDLSESADLLSIN